MGWTHPRWGGERHERTRFHRLDVDGTLVDSTYHHAMAWHRAFAMIELRQPLWRIHRRIGTGGDHLVSAVAGEEVEARLGDDLRRAWGTEYDKLIVEVIPLPGAADLIRSLKEKGFPVALASSGPREHTECSADLLGVKDLVDAITSSADADSSKPAADILSVDLRKCGGRDCSGVRR